MGGECLESPSPLTASPQRAAQRATRIFSFALWIQSHWAWRLLDPNHAQQSPAHGFSSGLFHSCVPKGITHYAFNLLELPQNGTASFLFSWPALWQIYLSLKSPFSHFSWFCAGRCVLSLLSWSSFCFILWRNSHVKLKCNYFLILIIPCNFSNAVAEEW